MLCDACSQTPVHRLPDLIRSHVNAKLTAVIVVAKHTSRHARGVSVGP